VEPSRTFVEVGKWTGPLFFWLWYADIYASESDRTPFYSINALTRRGAVRRAKRQVRRTNILTETITYVYDNDRGTLIEIF
jgi:hypothetical protein